MLFIIIGEIKEILLQIDWNNQIVLINIIRI